jgi:hypothetical protein
MSKQKTMPLSMMPKIRSAPCIRNPVEMRKLRTSRDSMPSADTRAVDACKDGCDPLHRMHPPTHDPQPTTVKLRVPRLLNNVHVIVKAACIGGLDDMSESCIMANDKDEKLAASGATRCLPPPASLCIGRNWRVDWSKIDPKGLRVVRRDGPPGARVDGGQGRSRTIGGRRRLSDWSTVRT